MFALIQIKHVLNIMFLFLFFYFINFFPNHRSVVPKKKSNSKMIFMAQSQRQTAAGLWCGVCRTSWHACSSADKHMVDITDGLLSYRNQ